MDYTYEHVTTQYGQQLIRRQPDEAWIPVDANNGDYVQYLDWIGAGNVPVEINFGEVSNG